MRILVMIVVAATAMMTATALAQTKHAEATTLPSATTQPTTQPATQPVAPLDAEKMLDQLLRAKPGTAKPLQSLPNDDQQVKSRRHAGIAPNTPDIPLKREGDVISSRVGRLQKAQREGDWEFAFESDGKALQDPPITLLPNRALGRMEAAVEKSGMDLRFRLTGVVTQYHGQNFLLIEKAEIVPDEK